MDKCHYEKIEISIKHNFKFSIKQSSNNNFSFLKSFSSTSKGSYCGLNLGKNMRKVFLKLERELNWLYLFRKSIRNTQLSNKIDNNNLSKRILIWKNLII